MSRLTRYLCVIGLPVCLSSALTQNASGLLIHDDFSTGTHGWIGSFADYPIGAEAFYELDWDWRVGPPGNAQSQLYITGNNHSDDLFMYFVKPVTGLLPETAYTIDFDITFWSMYPAESAGVGGSPGSGVFLKAGATAYEPQRVLDELDDWRLNIDKDRHDGGGDAIALGHIGTDLDTFTWTQLSRNSDGQKFHAKTDTQGTLWLLFGTDSGYESTTQLYYSSYTAEFSLSGDLDNDGFVGLSDLDLLLSNWNRTVPPADPRADVAGPGGSGIDGFVGLDDLDIVLNNWNAGTPPIESMLIPEPASLMLMGLGATVLSKRRTHHVRV